MTDHLTRTRPMLIMTEHSRRNGERARRPRLRRRTRGWRTTGWYRAGTGRSDSRHCVSTPWSTLWSTRRAAKQHRTASNEAPRPRLSNRSLRSRDGPLSAREEIGGSSSTSTTPYLHPWRSSFCGENAVSSSSFFSLSFFFSLMYISVSFISLCASSYLSTFTRRISDLLQSLAGTVSRAQVYSGFHGFLFLPLSRDTLDNRHFFLYHLVLRLATGHCFPFCSVFVLPLRSIAFARCIHEKLYT